MDLAGMSLGLIEVVGVVILGIALLVMVMRTRSRGKIDNTPADDRATRERYAEAEADRKSHPDSGD